MLLYILCQSINKFDLNFFLQLSWQFEFGRSKEVGENPVDNVGHGKVSQENNNQCVTKLQDIVDRKKRSYIYHIEQKRTYYTSKSIENHQW